MKKLRRHFAILFSLCFGLLTLSLPLEAGNVLIKKHIDVEIADDESSFEHTEFNATVSNISWHRTYAVCRVDCLFSGFDGSIENLKINGHLIHAGDIEVINSRIMLPGLGEVIVYIANDIIVLALSAGQAEIIHRDFKND